MWNKDLETRAETIKLLENDIRKMFLDSGLRLIFFYMAPKAKATAKQTSRTT